MVHRGRRNITGLIAEVVFAILPVVVVAIILTYHEKSRDVFASPEWTFAAAILFGQTLAKFISGIARRGGASAGPVELTVALLVVLGLAPSLLVLALAVEIHESDGHASIWLQASQMVLFLASVVTYVLLGSVGESWSDVNEH